MATLSDLQAAQSLSLTNAYKARTNAEAARIAALVSLYYQQRVNPQDPQSVEAWVNLMVPRMIAASDSGAVRAAAYYAAVRRLEAPGAEPFVQVAATGFLDAGVRKSLLAKGPFDFMNKLAEIKGLSGISDQQRRALEADAKQLTTKAVAASVLRHAQAGGRQTIFDNSARDSTALGWIRVTKADPCFFCAMLASRGIHYNPYNEGSFVESDARFSGDGDAKVHDSCGCCLKPVYTKNDPLVDRTKEFTEMWSEWSGSGDMVNNFRMGYEHFRRTGERLSLDEILARRAA